MSKLVLSPKADKASQDLRPFRNERIAIIGMSCLFPNSPTLSAFWSNIFHGRDCMREVADGEWGSGILHGDQKARPDRDRFGNIYCRKAGFVTDLADFDPPTVGVMPKTVDGSDPDQMLGLRVACEAMSDAGYLKREFDPHKAEVILGRTSAPGRGSMNMIQNGHTIGQVVSVASKFFPEWSSEKLDQFADELRSSLSPCNSDTIPGAMPNILAARIAGRLGFHGKSVVLDSACASSLVAVEMAVDDLRSGKSDLALTGGVFINSMACFTQMFCGLEALSLTEDVKPFDDQADGTLLGEGIGIVVLKRLSDALADGDRIYATIAGVASSSDGKGTSMLAPASEGEALAISRAYDDAGVSPLDTGYFEAHGTGTKSGDIAELRALQMVFDKYAAGLPEGATRVKHAIGSVKAMIGHAQAASGIAGMIKAALALYHRVLPVTMSVQTPNSHFDWDKSGLYLSGHSRPWIHPTAHPELSMISPDRVNEHQPRRASVSAFGFGGVNAHVVLEECKDDYFNQTPNLLSEWPTELLVFEGPDQKSVEANLARVETWLMQEGARDVPLKDIAYSVSENLRLARETNANRAIKLAIIASTKDDLLKKLAVAKNSLSTSVPADLSSSGVYLSNPTADEVSKTSDEGRTAFLLPGLGSAYPNMLSELCIHFPEVRAIFDYVDYVAKSNRHSEIPSEKVFPRGEVGKRSSSSTIELASMDAAVVTVLMAEWALFAVLLKLGIVPDVLVGCSTGEFAALTMSGAVNILTGTPAFYHLSTSVANAVPKDKLADLRSIKVKAPLQSIAAYIKDAGDVYLSGDLSPTQVLLTGVGANIDKLVAELERNSYEADYLPAAIPYHTSLVKGMVATDRKEVEELELYRPEIESWSCSIADQYPTDPDATKRIMTELFSKPILFRETIERLYEQGVRRFVEIGPKDTLSPVVSEILSDRDHLAVASNKANVSAIYQLQHMLALLNCQGTEFDAQYLFARRQPTMIDFAKSESSKKSKTLQKLKLAYPEISLKPGWQERIGFDPASHAQPITNSVAEHEQPLAAHSAYPLLRGANCYQLGEEVILDVTVDLNHHQYLLDHAIGGTVRQWPDFSERLHLLPLTVALEMMSEAATSVYAEATVSELRNVRAFKRIRVGPETSTLRLVARPLNALESAVQVSIYRAEDLSDESKQGFVQPAMSCEVVFGEREIAPTLQLPESPEEWRTTRFQPGNLYGSDAMFHGPRMQSVMSVDGLRSSLIHGQVAARELDGWFSPEGTPPQKAGYFVLDPLLLDNATQLVLYYLLDGGEPAHALLPFMIDSLKIYTDLSFLDNAAVTVIAHFNELNARGTDANVYLLGADGQMLASFNSIKSRRIALDQRWQKAIFEPVGCFVSDVKNSGLPNVELAYVDDTILPGDEATIAWCADYLLTPGETKTYEALPNPRRKREWLLGRIAAKDAVRRILMNQYDIQSTYADVEISSDTAGAPVVFSTNLAIAQMSTWNVSITHKGNVAYAVAINAEEVSGVGVDLEEIAEREDGFERLAFSPTEQQVIQSIGERNQSIAVAWAAKEAVAKATRLGFQFDPKTFAVEAIEKSNDVYIVTVGPTAKPTQEPRSTMTKVRTTEVVVQVAQALVIATCFI